MSRHTYYGDVNPTLQEWLDGYEAERYGLPQSECDTPAKQRGYAEREKQRRRREERRHVVESKRTVY